MNPGSLLRLYIKDRSNPNDSELWHHVEEPSTAAKSDFFSEDGGIENQLCSLGSIYRNLPSPTPDYGLLSRLEPTCRDLLECVLRETGPPQLVTELLPFQKRTVHKMLQRELAPQKVSDPWPVPKVSPTGERYNVDPQSLNFFLSSSDGSRPRRDVKGGVLCEEMGVGKTVITLSVILYTLGNLAKPEWEPMLTPLTSKVALSYFPQERYKGADPGLSLIQSHSFKSLPYYQDEEDDEDDEESEQAHSSRSDEQSESHDDTVVAATSACKVPRLVQLAAHRVRSTGAPFRHLLDGMPSHLRELLVHQAAPLLYLWPEVPSRFPRVPPSRRPRQIFLGPTLVIVPHTLIAQWLTEIDKHCPHSLRVLVLANTKDRLPSPDNLAQDYDLVLLSHNRFGKEEDDGLLQNHFPGVPRKCRCPYIGATRIVDCRCPKPPSEADVSPLMQVYWKRLVIDEGHAMSSATSMMVKMACRLRVECKWIVSGTPTATMVGSPLDAEGQQDHEGEGPASGRSKWSVAERKDMDRLKALLVTFLQIPHFFQSQPTDPCRNWNQHVVNPLFTSEGPAWGSRSRLKTILSSVMVRNQSCDVKKDHPLPPLVHRIMKLDFTRMERLTFNCLQALLLLNKVFTRQEDQDYLFHKSNRKELSNVMENLSNACFHYAGKEFVSLISFAVRQYEKHMTEEKWRYEEREEAGSAARQLKRALADRAWRAKIEAADVAYQISCLPDEVRRSWRAGLTELQDGKMPADEVMRMRQAALDALTIKRINFVVGGSAMTGENSADSPDHIDDEDMIEELITAGQKDVSKRLETLMAGRRKRKESKKFEKLATEKEQSMAVPSKVNKSPMGKSSSAGRARKSHPSNDGVLKKPGLDDRWKDNVEDRIPAPPTSFLSNLRVNATSSTKLSAVLDEVLSNHLKEKIIIFSTIDNVLFELGSALELANIDHLLYVAGLTQDRRNSYAKAFVEESRFRVLLMSPNVGGRGLDLHAASRVICCEPIWAKDLEMQAIKRAWRIGQTRPVNVTTFVIKDTFEEAMLERRKLMNNLSSSQGANHGFQASNSGERSADTGQIINFSSVMTDDPGMRYFISNPTFVQDPDGQGYGDDPDLVKLKTGAFKLFISTDAQDELEEDDTPFLHHLERPEGGERAPAVKEEEGEEGDGFEMIDEPSAVVEIKREVREEEDFLGGQRGQSHVNGMIMNQERIEITSEEEDRKDEVRGGILKRRLSTESLDDDVVFVGMSRWEWKRVRVTAGTACGNGPVKYLIRGKE
ncbi:hypothetical protein IE53DRAFT_408107 [Violaceomyces palustris]|uniref:Uncharacterized protein n=1 Tax=Violaceomyces palustris TaxID=1673888 RepID=A0ACD0P7Y6_9BASI|nr:hypothetical protein IE53DRAFT_408107 [Violaceomyces palustris]